MSFPGPYTIEFAELIGERSKKHGFAFEALSSVPSVQAGIIRFELDSLLRATYVCSLPVSEREDFCREFFHTGHFKNPRTGKRITDRAMSDIAGGWVELAYSMGCAIAHLSYLHDDDPSSDFALVLGDLSDEVEAYLETYHERPISGNLRLDTIWPYLPAVFEKISSNIEYYLEGLVEQEPPEYLV